MNRLTASNGTAAGGRLESQPTIMKTKVYIGSNRNPFIPERTRPSCTGTTQARTRPGAALRGPRPTGLSGPRPDAPSTTAP